MYFPSFNVQFVDPDTGDALSLGKVYAFYSDGVTPAPTYNQAGNENPHPFTLTTAGTFQLKGDDSISYTLIAKRADGSSAGSWVGVSIPSGGGGAAVTMDTIAQGTAYKKFTSSQYTSLTSGSNSTLHYHSADRVWSSITGKPTTISGYGITNAYTKTETDALVGGFVEKDGDLTMTGAYRISGTAGSSVNINPGDGGSQAANVVLAHGNGSTAYTSVFGNSTMLNGAHVVDTNSTFSYGMQAYDGVAEITLSATDTVDNSSSCVIQRVCYLDNAPKERIIIGNASAKVLIYPTDASGTFATREWVVANLPTLTNGYNHTQSVPSTVWTITHSLGYKPVVQAWNSSDDVINGTIHHVSINQVTILFSSGQSGGARCV